ncbi:MAG: carboxypeptidase regulatory-like domain-containing protein [Planctomycetes bacterium]|nr:carboxypeptidase regulatory-like domain-containing protein [Planctomycetota bacterium]
MTDQLLRRPSTLVVLCATVVITSFVAKGDLRIETDASKRAARATSSAVEPRAEIVRASAPAPRRAVELARLSGRVLDALGYPVPHAEVEAMAGASVTAGPDGRFALELATGSYADLFVRGRGYRARWLRAPLTSPDPLFVQLEPEAPWDLEPEATVPPALTGEGTVRDEAGAPLAGAYVTAAGSGIWSLTDEIGRYTLPLYGSQARLLVQDARSDFGFVGRSGPLELGRDHGVVPLPELVAETGAMVQGRLHDADGQPVEGAPILLRGEGVARVCESGMSGRFCLKGLLLGRYEIRPLPWSGAFGEPRAIVLEGAVTECELQLEKPQQQKVLVCHEDGVPVGNAYVAVIVEGNRSNVARADEQGFAEVPFGPGAVEFEVRGEDGASAMSVRGLDRDQGRLVVAAP